MSLELSDVTNDIDIHAALADFDDLAARILDGELPFDSECLPILRAAGKGTNDLKAKVQELRDEAAELAAYSRAQYEILVAEIRSNGGPSSEVALSIIDAAGKDVADLMGDLKAIEKQEAAENYKAMLADAVIDGQLPSVGYAQAVCEAAGFSIHHYQAEFAQLTGANR